MPNIGNAAPTTTPAATGTGTTPVVIPNARADSVYQDRITQMAQALANYRSQEALGKSQYQGQYDTTLHNLGWNNGTGGWNTTGNQQYANTYNANQGDFAGRGDLHSSNYANAVGAIDSQFNQQKTALDTGRQNYLDTQNQADTQYTQQNATDQQNALMEARQRIAGRYGVPYNRVPVSPLEPTISSSQA